MFFNTHRCSALCAALGLSPFSHPQRRSPVLSPPLLTKQSTVVTQTPIPVDASAVAGGGAVTSAPWSTLGLREALAHSVSPGAIPVAVRGRVSLPKLSVLVARVTMLRSLRNLRPMQSGGRGRLESDDTARHALGAGPAEAARTALVVAGDGAGHGQRGFQNRHLHECDHTDAGVLAVGAGVGAGRGARNHPGASVDRRRKGCSDGAASTPTAHGSGTTTTTASAMTHTPSLLPCCCIDMVRVVHSRTRRRCLQRALAQVHWTTARLCGGGTFTRAGVTRADACMFHLIQAADYGYTEAIATLAAIFGKVATDVIARRFVRRQASLRKRACLVFVAADKLRVRWCVEMLAYHRQQGLTTTRGEVVITKDTEQAAKLYLLAISLPPTSSPVRAAACSCVQLRCSCVQLLCVCVCVCVCASCGRGWHGAALAWSCSENSALRSTTDWCVVVPFFPPTSLVRQMMCCWPKCKTCCLRWGASIWPSRYPACSPTRHWFRELKSDYYPFVAPCAVLCPRTRLQDALQCTTTQGCRVVGFSMACCCCFYCFVLWWL